MSRSLRAVAASAALLVLLTAGVAMAGTLTAVAPSGATAGVALQITGTGLNAVAAENDVTFIPASGAPQTVTATSVVVLDAATGRGRLTVTVPAGLSTGPAALRVTNRATGETSDGRTVQILTLALGAVRGGQRGSAPFDVEVIGSTNVAFVGGGGTRVTLGAGITVQTVTVVSPTRLLVRVAIEATAATGPRALAVNTSQQMALAADAFLVASPNQSPAVSINGPYSGTAGAALLFSSAGTSDPDGDALTYEWAFGDGGTSTAAQPSHTYVAAGTYDVTLTVRDGTNVSTVATQATIVAAVNRPPIAASGGPYSSVTGRPIRFSSLGSHDVDADVLTLVWDFGDGASGVGVAPQHTYLSQGTYAVTLLVADGKGGVAISRTLARVTASTPLNSAPLARIGGPYTAVVGQPVTFDAAGSTDPERHTLSFAWTLGDGATATGVAPRHVYAAPATYEITVLVTDGHGGGDTATATVVVTAPPVPQNAPPVADAGPDRSIRTGTLLTLDASASADPDGDALTFAWSFGDGASGVTTQPQHRYTQPGTYTVTLLVSDGRGGSATDTATVTVSAEPGNGAPTATITGPLTTIAGVDAVFGTTAVDPDGDPLSFSWTFGDGSSAAAMSVTHRWLTSGVYPLSLAVSDGRGGLAIVAVEVVVLPAPSANGMPVSDPGGPYAGEQDVSIAFDGQGSMDPDGDTLTFLWSFGDDTTAIGDRPAHVYARAGTYTVTLLVSDGRGGLSTATTQVVVRGATARNNAPTARPGGPYTSHIGLAVPFDAASASDPDGDTLAYRWDFGDQSAADQRAPQHVYTQPGTYTVTLTVTDASGASDSATAFVTIGAAADRAPPVVSLLAPSEVVPGATVVLTAHVADDQGIAGVRFEIQGAEASEVTGAPYRRTFVVPSVVSPGQTIVVRAIASDTSQNTAEASATIRIVATPDTEPPLVTLSAPAQTSAGATVRLVATATDNTGVASVVFARDGSTIAETFGPVFETAYVVPATAVSGATLTFTARAVDASGNAADVQTSVRVESSPDTTPPSVVLSAPATLTVGGVLPLSAQATDSGGIASVTFLLNGVAVATDTQAPFVFAAPYPAGTPAGAVIAVTVRATDFANLSAEDARSVLVVSAGDSATGLISGAVYDDATGLPVQGAIVQLAGNDASGHPYAGSMTTDTRGWYVLRGAPGTAVVVVSKPGWTRVDRRVALDAGRVTRAFGARLTRLAPAASVPPLAGGNAGGDLATISVPPGALSTTITLAATTIGRQGLQGLLPPGWSPVAAVDVTPHGMPFSAVASLRVRHERVQAGAALVLVTWDESVAAWRVVNTSAPATSGELLGDVAATGQFAWIVADAVPVVPPSPVATELLAGVASPVLPDALEALIVPQPNVLFYRPGVHADVRGTLTMPVPVSSGVQVLSRVRERYSFATDTQAAPAAFEHDFVFYQAVATGLELATAYRVSPSLTFEAAQLREGVIGITHLSSAAETSARIGDVAGGVIPGTGGVSLVLPPGAVSAPMAFDVSTIVPTDLGVTLPGDVTLATAVAVGFSGELAHSATLTVPRPAGYRNADAARIVLVRLEEIGGQTRLVLAGLARINGDTLSSDLTLAGRPTTLEGVRRPGRYLFVRFADAVGPLAFAEGLTRAGGSAMAGVLVTGALPVASLSRQDGRYFAVSAAGAQTLTALDVVRSDSGTASATLVAGQALALDIALVAQVPWVTSIAPLDAAVDVPLSDPLIAEFSEPIDPATVTVGTSVVLTSGAVAVAGTIALTNDNQRLTFRPSSPLAANTSHVFRLTTGITDRSGHSLDREYSVAFTSLNTAPPPAPPAGSLSATIPDANGLTTVTATQGTAGPRDKVWILNVTKGTSTLVTLDSNGGFSTTVAAGLTDTLKIQIVGPSGHESLADVGLFRNADGSVAVPPSGGLVTAGELTLSIAEGTFPNGSIVRFTQLPQETITARTGPDYPFVAAFEVSSTAPPQRYLNVSAPVPDATASTAVGLVAKLVTVFDRQALSIVDTARIIAGRLATSSPPCQGIVDTFGHYAMYLNRDEQMAKLGIALLSMAVPQRRSVVIQPYSTTLTSYAAFPPTLLHPPMQFESTYNPALPFIAYIEATGDAVAGVEQSADPDLLVPVCLPTPANTPLRIVARDAATGARLAATETVPGSAGTEAAVDLTFVSDDQRPPTLLSASWHPRAPHILDLGEAIRLRFSEPVRVRASMSSGAKGIQLENQRTHEIVELTHRASDGGRVLELVPRTVLPLGTDFTLRLPGVVDSGGNGVAGSFDFRTFEPQPTVSRLLPPDRRPGSRPRVQRDLLAAGVPVSPTLEMVGLRDIDFITRESGDPADGRWVTSLFGIGGQRERGFQLLAMDASDASGPAATGALSAGPRTYTRVRVFPDVHLDPRPLDEDDPRTKAPALTDWRARHLYSIETEPTQRVCGEPGSAHVEAWKARQPEGSTFVTATGCGDLAIATSYNIYYGILHFYDVTDPAEPRILGQRLLSDNGVLGGFPRRNDSPAGSGVPGGFTLFTAEEFAHTSGVVEATNLLTNVAVVANRGVGLAAVDVDWNVPDLELSDRPPLGDAVESLDSYSFPYFSDVTMVGGRIVAVAGDRTDGTGVAHLELFDTDLNPQQLPVPLDSAARALATIADLTFDGDYDGEDEAHDVAVVLTERDLTFVDVPRPGAPTLQPTVIGALRLAPGVMSAALSSTAVPDQGQAITALEGACPEAIITVGVRQLKTRATTLYRDGGCADLSVGQRVTTIAAPGGSGQPPFAVAVTLVGDERPRYEITAARHIEIDQENLLGYIAATWRRDGTTVDGLIAVDVSDPLRAGPDIDANGDGWDDRILGFVPIAGPNQFFPAGIVNGFRIDARRNLIYAAFESQVAADELNTCEGPDPTTWRRPCQGDAAAVVILSTCDCIQSADIRLTSSGAGTNPDKPSADGETATLLLDSDVDGSPVLRANFDAAIQPGTTVRYRLTEAIADGSAPLLNLPGGAIEGVLAAGAHQFTVPLIGLDAYHTSSAMVAEFIDQDGNLLKKAVVDIVPTSMQIGDTTVDTYMDMWRRKTLGSAGYLSFALNHGAQIAVAIDGVPKPELAMTALAGLNQIYLSREMVGDPGEHTFELVAQYEDGVERRQTGRLWHQVHVSDPLPIGHTFVKGVDVFDGHLALSREDIAIPGVGPQLRFSRTYSNLGNRGAGVMGAGWSHNFESRLEIQGEGDDVNVTVIGTEGGSVPFDQLAVPGGVTFKAKAGYHGTLEHVARPPGALPPGALAAPDEYHYYTKGRTRYRFELALEPGPRIIRYRLKSISDPNGNTLELAYDETGRLAVVTDAVGRTLTFTYARFGRPAVDRVRTVKGPLGLVLYFDYDQWGNLVCAVRNAETCDTAEILDPATVRLETYSYSVGDGRDRHNLQGVTDPNGNRTAYEYFAPGDSVPGEQPEFDWMTSIVVIPQKHELVKAVVEGDESPDEATTRFAYDLRNYATEYRTTVTDGREIQTVYVSNPRGGAKEVTVRTADGDNTTRMTWAYDEGIDDVYPMSRTEANGRVTRFTHDPVTANLLKERIDSTSLGAPYQPVADRNGAAPTSGEVATEYAYHSTFNKVERKADPEGNVTRYEIDSETGDVLREERENRYGPSLVTKYSYLDVTTSTGRVLKGLLGTVVAPGDRETTYLAYDQWGNATGIEDPEGNITERTFDERGRLLSTVDVTVGRRTEYRDYDQLDRPARIVKSAIRQPDDASMHSPDVLAAYEYYAGGQTKKITAVGSTGHVTEFGLDALNRVKTQTDITPSVTVQRAFTYDAAGNKVREEIRPGAGAPAELTYHFIPDELNRIERTDVSDASGRHIVSRTDYDPGGNAVAEYDHHGHKTAHTLDALYRRVRTDLPSVTRCEECSTGEYAVVRTFDLVGNELTTSDPNGFVTSRTFDSLGRKLTETDALANSTTWAYDEAGNVLTEDHRAGGVFVSKQEFAGYDGLNRPLRWTITFSDPAAGSSTGYQTSVVYDDEGHSITRTRHGASGGPDSVTTDVLNGFDKVITRTTTGGLLDGPLVTTFRYDEFGNEVAVKDSEGDVVDVARTFDGLGRNLDITYAGGDREEFTHDTRGNVVTRKRVQRGITQTFSYDHLNRPTGERITQPVSGGGELQLTRTVYDDVANSATTYDADPAHEPTVTQYDALHRAVEITDAAGKVSRFEWDGVNKRTETSRDGRKRRFAYDARNRLTMTKEFDVDDRLATTLTTDYLDGDLRQIERDRRETSRILQFDGLKRLRTESVQHAELTSPYGSGTVRLKTIEYDSRDNVVAEIDGGGSVVRYEYDAADRRRRMIEGAGSPVQAVTLYEYFDSGKLKNVTDPRPAPTFDRQFTYDERDRKRTETDGEGNTTTYLEYDQDGNLLRVREPAGEITAYAYDELNELLSVDMTRGGAGGVTYFRYDANRNKTAQQDANGNLTTYEYDVLNRLTRRLEHTVSGSLGGGGGSAGGNEGSAAVWRYGYDNDGNQTLLVDAEGQTTNTTFDYLNRPTSQTYTGHKTGAGGEVSYPRLVSMASRYDANGNLLEVKEEKQLAAGGATVTEVTAMAYDRLNRLRSRTNDDGKAITFTYDAQGNRRSVTDADLVATCYVYDARNRLSSATTEVTDCALAGAVGQQVTRYEYWPDGLQKKVQYPNGSIAESSYDAADRVTAIVNHDGDPASPISQYSYTYDVNGNRLTQAETRRQLTGGQAETTRYEYDALNRLTRVEYPDGATTAYALERNGNRRTEIGTDPATGQPVDRIYSYNTRNQLLTVVDRARPDSSRAFAYDRNGNTVEERAGPIDESGVMTAPITTKRFQFDIRDRLTAAIQPDDTITFDYDYTGMRTKKTIGSVDVRTRFIYDGISLLQEYDAASGATTSKYNYGSRLLSLVSGSGPTRESLFYLVDALGSTSDLTNGSGDLRASYAYDAYGSMRRSADATGNRRRFTGHYEDTETGLQYFGARYYDAAIGRFLNQDTFLGRQDQPPSLHRYLYAHVNPTVLVDPDGHEAKPPMAELVDRTVERVATPHATSIDGVTVESGLDLSTGLLPREDGASVLSHEVLDLAERAGRSAAASGGSIVETAVWSRWPTYLRSMAGISSRIPEPAARGMQLHRLFENMPANNPGFDRLSRGVIDEIKTVGRSTKDVARVVRNATNQILTKPTSPYAAMDKVVTVVLEPGAGARQIAAVESAAVSSQATGVAVRVRVGLPSAAGTALKFLAPVGMVLSAAQLKEDAITGNWEGGVGSGTGLVAGIAGTAALAAPTVAAGGAAFAPPVAALAGGFSIGWTFGIPIGNAIDRRFTPGSGSWGQAYYDHVLK